jgi:hypothetical protein
MQFFLHTSHRYRLSGDKAAHCTGLGRQDTLVGDLGRSPNRAPRSRRKSSMLGNVSDPERVAEK